MFRRRCTLLVIFIYKTPLQGTRKVRRTGARNERCACMATSRLVSCSKEPGGVGQPGHGAGSLAVEASGVETSGLDAGCEESERRTSVHRAVGVEELDPCRPNVHESEANKPMHARYDLATLATRSRPISQKVFFAYSCQVSNTPAKDRTSKDTCPSRDMAFKSSTRTRGHMKPNERPKFGQDLDPHHEASGTYRTVTYY